MRFDASSRPCVRAWVRAVSLPPGGATPSSGDSAAAAGKDPTADVADAIGKLAGGLLALAAEGDRRPAAPGGNARPAGDGRTAAAGATPDETVFPPASGAPVRVPLIEGLQIVAARHEPGRGDYEPIVTVGDVSSGAISINYSANLPDGERISITRVIDRDDFRNARGYRAWFQEGDPDRFAGTTAFSLSLAAFRELKEQGRTDIVRITPHGNLLMEALGGSSGGAKREPATLQRVEPHAVGIPILLNGRPVEAHAIHARATFDDEPVDFYVLDDADNPVMLRAAGRNTGRVVRISFPIASEPSVASGIELKLKAETRVELDGIYFDFNKATLRPESEPVLRELAAALANNPDWKIAIEGHTDSIGGDSFNQDLSERRAHAVRQALIDRYRVSTAMTTAGFGASRPKASNDTLQGRARNRRVELVRQ